MTTTAYVTRLLRKNYLTKDVLELMFEKPDGFEYRAGQFVQWEIPSGDKSVFRSYSLSSSPEDHFLQFCLKLLPAGKASSLAASIAAGSELRFHGPMGNFTNTQKRPLYFVATSAGIAPIISIIRDELEHKKTEAEVRLLFGVRSEDDIFWQDRLEDLKSRFNNFTFHITLSQPKPDNGWGGLRGHVTNHILHHLVNHNFYLCGNAAMVKDVRQALIKNSISQEQIHFEIF